MKTLILRFSPLVVLSLFLLSCGTPEADSGTEIDADSTIEERIAPPDNAATEKDQPGIERPPVPEDSLADGEGKRVIGTSRP